MYLFLMLPKDVEILDALPQSTWKKVLCYDVEQMREQDSSQLRITAECLTPSYAEDEELDIKIAVLPIRCNLDQDTLDFMVSYFSSCSPSEGQESQTSTKPKETAVFFSNASTFVASQLIDSGSFSMTPVKVKLDFKPKHVDYTKIKEGNYFELIKLFPLEGASFTIPEFVVRGVAVFFFLWHL